MDLSRAFCVVAGAQDPKGIYKPIVKFKLYPPEKCRQEIEGYKKFYKIGKEKRVPAYILYNILNHGYHCSAYMYQICVFSKKEEFLEEFKNECVNFSKAAEGFVKLLGDEIVDSDLWKKRHEDFERYFHENHLEVCIYHF